MISRTTDEIEADIGRTREEIVATLSELDEKLDVKAHAKHAAVRAAHGARARRGPLALAAAVVVLATVGLVVRKRLR
ncbi:MAG: DUF3618 domain-containing protein [Marmoricola sp.]